MAKKTEDKLNYKQAVRSLKEQGPGRLYLLWGPEDYLREYYVSELKKLCLPDGEESFSLKRMTNFTIHGKKGSAAEPYAKVNNLSFKEA